MKEQILKLRSEGKTYNEIVKELDCAKSTISYYCKNPKSSKNWKLHNYTELELIEATINSKSILEVVNKLNLNVNGSSYKTLKRNIKKYKIDISHFTGQKWRKGRTATNELTKDEFIKKYLKILKIKISSHTLKLRLYKYNLKNEICESCGVGNLWNEKQLSLHLDHVNGNPKDNRIENLNILCPNCHSQTPTYAGKNIKKSLE